MGFWSWLTGADDFKFEEYYDRYEQDQVDRGYDLPTA